ncbi:hypothetical protein PAMP_000944 [Pampus punctatissimus]
MARGKEDKVYLSIRTRRRKTQASGLSTKALVVPPSVELSALFLTSGIRWSCGSHTGVRSSGQHLSGWDVVGQSLAQKVFLEHGCRGYVMPVRARPEALAYAEDARKEKKSESKGGKRKEQKGILI